MAVLVPVRVLAVGVRAGGREEHRDVAARCRQTEVRRGRGALEARVRIIGLQVVERGRGVDHVELGIAQRTLQRDHACLVIGERLSLNVTDGIGVDLAVAVGVVIARHELRERVGADEALLRRVIARVPIALEQSRQEEVLHVDLLAGRRIGAAAQRVVGIVPRVVEIHDDLELGVRVGGGVDEVHRLLREAPAIARRGIEAAVVARPGRALEVGTRLQEVVAAHLEHHDARAGVLHERLVGRRRHATVDAACHRARLTAAVDDPVLT